MEITNRTLAIVGTVLIGVGLLFFGLNFIPGWTLAMTWPVIFFVLAAGFFVPPFLFPSQRQWMAGLFIPGAVLLSLGIIFLYTTISLDWSAWAFAWLLIVAGVGLGLMLAGLYGNWGSGVVTVGVWMLLVNVALFALFGALFGGPALKLAAPFVLTLAGIVLLIRAFRR